MSAPVSGNIHEAESTEQSYSWDHGALSWVAFGHRGLWMSTLYLTREEIPELSPYRKGNRILRVCIMCSHNGWILHILRIYLLHSYWEIADRLYLTYEIWCKPWTIFMYCQYLWHGFLCSLSSVHKKKDLRAVPLFESETFSVFLPHQFYL